MWNKFSCPKLFSLLCAVCSLSGRRSPRFYLNLLFISFYLFYHTLFFLQGGSELCSVSYLTGGQTRYIRGQHLPIIVLSLYFFRSADTFVKWLILFPLFCPTCQEMLCYASESEDSGTSELQFRYMSLFLRCGWMVTMVLI